MTDEFVIGRINGRRKGRGQRPCEVVVAYTNANEVVLRTEDASGVPPIVVLFKRQEAAALAKLLDKAAESIW